MKAIVFDIDGTLIESMEVDTELYFSSVSTVLGPVEFRPSLDDYEHVTDSGILAQLLADNDLAVNSGTIGRIRERFVAGLAKHIESTGPFPMIHGAGRFIDELRNSNEHGIAIATGGWKQSALLKLGASGVDVRGIPMASCDDSHSRTEIMRVALAKLGTGFDSVTYFGDAEWDRRACRTLGWNFVAVGAALNGIQSYAEVSIR
ncbi:MAG: HAD family hydrolase [Pseudomonadota bacterium]